MSLCVQCEVKIVSILTDFFATNNIRTNIIVQFGVLNNNYSVELTRILTTIS